MQDFDAKWITNKDFFALEPINVFHKEMEDVKIPKILLMKTSTFCSGAHFLFRNSPKRFFAFLRTTTTSFT